MPPQGAASLKRLSLPLFQASIVSFISLHQRDGSYMYVHACFHSIRSALGLARPPRRLLPREQHNATLICSNQYKPTKIVSFDCREASSKCMRRRPVCVLTRGLPDCRAGTTPPKHRQGQNPGGGVSLLVGFSIINPILLYGRI